MAIKPNDCVIKIEDLVVGYDHIKNWAHGTDKIPVYETYWTNFLQHVKETTDEKAGWDAYDKNFVRELTKFNAVYKNTKKWQDRYIKFKSHSDLTYFVLRWA